MYTVHVTVTVYSEAGEETLSAGVIKAAEDSDPRLAAFGALQDSGPEFVRQLGISRAEAVQFLSHRVGDLMRTVTSAFGVR